MATGGPISTEPPRPHIGFGLVDHSISLQTLTIVLCCLIAIRLADVGEGDGEGERGEERMKNQIWPSRSGSTVLYNAALHCRRHDNSHRSEWLCSAYCSSLVFALAAGWHSVRCELILKDILRFSMSFDSMSPKLIWESVLSDL